MESISAGDMEKYGYCPLSWWLSRGSDISDEGTEKGVHRHREMEKKLDRARESLDRSKGFERAVFWSAILATMVSMVGVTMAPQFSRTIGNGENAALSGGYILAFLALVWLLAAAYFLYRVEKMGSAEMRNKAEVIITIFSIVAMLLALYSVTYLIPTTDNQLATLAQALALMWLIGASLFLYKSISLHNRYSGAKKDAGLEKGELEYHDSTKYRPKMLVSEAQGIRGRPDYLLKTGEEIIPVEMKTGRVPKGPLFSHILQLSTYCFLVEEAYKKVPPYGIIRYGQTEFQIEYTPEMKQMVLVKASEMRERLATGDVHRNHSRESKCRYCSRRAICPEKLV